MSDRTPASQPPVFNSNAYSPAEIKQAVEKVGVKKTRLPFSGVVHARDHGGRQHRARRALLYPGRQRYNHLSLTAVGRILGGVAFSLGLILVVVAGAELFTGNNLLVMAWASHRLHSQELLRNWLVVYLANFAGALGLVELVLLSNYSQMNGAAVATQAVKIAAAKGGPRCLLQKHSLKACSAIFSFAWRSGWR